PRLKEQSVAAQEAIVGADISISFQKFLTPSVCPQMRQLFFLHKRMLFGAIHRHFYASDLGFYFVG
ncbi:hypothetical protein QP226_10210, partial [Aerococcus urinae]|uniref:hypothetical protein n=1 Tax=Aerococcus urinae TaxID=1376 RepID=UPI00254CDCEC